VPPLAALCAITPNFTRPPNSPRPEHKEHRHVLPEECLEES
jgi:hypothetical protein